MSGLTSFSNLISAFNPFLAGIYALLLLLLTFLVAWIAQKLTVALLNKLGAEKYLSKTGIEDTHTKNSVVWIGKLVFLIVFLLFLPGVLEKLGLVNVAAPIVSMVSDVLSYVPNLIGAIILLVVGYLVANLIRSLVQGLLVGLKVDELPKKYGYASDHATVSYALAYVVYVLVLIPVVIASLDVLNITAISVPAVAMLTSIFNVIPKIILAIAVVLVGVVIASVFGKLLLGLLGSVGLDSMVSKAIPQAEKFNLSDLIVYVVKAFIILLFVIEGLNIVKLEVLTSVGNAILSYLPLLVSAAFIVLLAYLVAAWLKGLILARNPEAKFFANCAQVAILVLAGFMALSQLAIAPVIVNYAFIIILGAFGVAFALAFGLGGKDFIAGILRKAETPENIQKVSESVTKLHDTLDK